MASQFEVVGWEDFDGNRYEGWPDDISQVHGELVHIYDPDTGITDHFWAFTLYAFDDWDEWYDYLLGMADSNYGQALE